MARLASTAKAGYYPTPPRVVEAIAKILDLPYSNHPLSICDPCCGEGDALSLLAERLGREKFQLYGAELSAERAEKAKEKLDKVIQGDALKLYVQPKECFSLVFLNPPYDSVGGKRLEYEFLKLGTRILAPGAPMIFIIPHYIVGKIADYWSLWFERTICLKFPESEFKVFKQIVLIGEKVTYRRFKPDQDEKRFLKLVQLLNEAELEKQNLKSYYSKSKRYYIADPEETEYLHLTYELPIIDPPQVFMLSDVTEEDLKKFAEKSGLSSEFFSTHSLPDPTIPFRPIMSLRQGHLVQVLISGALNGKINDRKGNEIWVKGSVWKEFQEQEEYYEDEGEKTSRQTYIKVRREKYIYSITYWTPEGELKKVTL